MLRAWHALTFFCAGSAFASILAIEHIRVHAWAALVLGCIPIYFLVENEAFLESLDDASFDKFALGYLHGISTRLRRYEELLGVRFSK